MEEIRKQFEQWAISRYGENYVRMDLNTGEYDVRVIQAHWECWKASRAALVAVLPDKVMVEDEFDSGHNCAIDYCSEAVRAAGITVKGEGDE